MEDLKKIVVEALDKNGSLDMIRAQLRSSVFGAIQSEQNKAVKTEASKMMESEPGQFSAELLRDFLEKSEAINTLHVFSLESQIHPDTKSKVQKRLGLPSDGTPGLFKLIKDFKSRFVPSEPIKKEVAKKEETKKEEVKKEEVKKVEAKIDEKTKNDEINSDYSEDFEEIEEDIEVVSQDTGGRESHKYYESAGSSGGVDPSVDSLALDQCDYLEPVKRPKN
ncbi:hypothetical protein SteCoe_30786 [Stentor coeruleus]|uniref:FGFR1 oncogene partner (FOP) N-terminal dimerisation domain-containing protein n=1 Tax=Stentor coeruleus TaxID=5963 RepID=A0A1R2B2T6_9CILI|nr:hypothetical protein SteCoe_30786 [Stentor coeruleus]